MKTTLFGRIKCQSKKTLIGVVAFWFLLAAAFITFLFPPKTLSSVDQFQVEDLNDLPDIEPDTILAQTFMPADNFDGFGLLFASQNQLFDTGTIEIEILHEQTLVSSCSTEIRGLMDISFFYCEVPLAAGQQYEIVISANDISLPFTFFSTSAQIDHAALKINEKPQDRLIVMNFIQQRNNYMLTWGFAVLANLVACYLAANLGKESHGSKQN